MFASLGFLASVLCATSVLAVAVPEEVSTLVARAVTPLSASALASLTPFTQFARAAYCDPSIVKGWNCGAACRANPGFEVTLNGGDGGDIQYYFVGYWSTQSTIIVSHQGTDPVELESVLTDLFIQKSSLNPTLFPGAGSSQVHTGFKKAQEETALLILTEVKRLIAVKGAKKIVTVGHSLGGAIAELDALMFRLQLPAEIDVKTITYGSPRVGNQAFATFLDSKVSDFKRITHDNDLVPIIPGRFLGFAHAGDEIHIISPGRAVSCPGADNAVDSDCSVSVVPNVFFGNLIDHLGPYEGVFLATFACNA